MTRLRRALVAALVGVFSITVVAATIGLWADRTALRTDRFVAVTRSLPRDATVNRALATFLTDDLRFLVGPLEGIVHDYTRDAVGDVLRSDQFQRVWVDAVRAAHKDAVAVLRDDVDVPAVVRDDGATRGEIREALTDAFGIELPADFGQFTVFDDDKLSQVQDIVALVERFVRILVAGSVVLVAAAIALSVDRRRTLVQAGVGIAIATCLVFTLLRRVVADLVDLVPEGQVRDAVRAATAVVADGLRDRAWLLLVAGLVVAAAAYLAGPGRGAIWLRGFARAVVGRAGAGASVFPATPTGQWVQVNVDGLRVAGVVVIVVAL